ncbi:MAG: hypothetical protein Q4A71_04815 [Actinomycetaceae bacterium]|nr:hypothetical protein [Actinomycetaceae bacterium]
MLGFGKAVAYLLALAQARKPGLCGKALRFATTRAGRGPQQTSVKAPPTGIVAANVAAGIAVPSGSDPDSKPNRGRSDKPNATAAKTAATTESAPNERVSGLAAANVAASVPGAK